MEKVYLLLRNNQQTGPYNLEELSQFDLKPYDLIWIEGKSAGWWYPQEIQALHPYLPFLKENAEPAATISPEQLKIQAETNSPRKVFVSMPTKPLEEEKAPTASPYQEPSYKAATYDRQEIQPEQLKTTYAKSLDEVEKDYTSWVYQKKTKKKPAVSKRGMLAACLITGIAFAGWWAVRSFTASPGKAELAQTAFVPVQNDSAPDSASVTEASQSNSVSALVKRRKQSKLSTTSKQPSKSLKQEAATPPASKVVVRNTTPKNNDYEATSMPKGKTEAVVKEDKADPVVAEAPPVKKKLHEKFLDLFKKKKEEPPVEAKPSEEEGGERRAARRDANANLATLVSVKFDIPNDWMMGVKGAKAALTNRSNETILKATVEVLYYNEDNELLDKKTIYFSNIGAKKTQSVPVADHSFADHLDYKIISVLGAEPVAKL